MAISEGFRLAFSSGMRKPRRLANFLLTIFAVLAISISPAEADWVETNAESGGYLITGGFVASSTYEKDRYEAATCQNCHWLVSAICISWDDENHGWCPYMVGKCPTGSQISEVFRANSVSRPILSSSLWRRTGYTCVGPNGPLSSQEIFSQIRESKFIKIPSLEFSTLPPGKSIVNLTFKIEFSSAAVIPDRQITVAGIPVIVRAAANRDIRCLSLDSCRNLTSRSLVFLNPGVTSFRVQSRWFGSFDALGLYAVPLDESAIVQTINRSLPVFEIHRRLTN